MLETLGTFSWLHTCSVSNLSLISQANIVGFSFLYFAIASTTGGVATLGLLPPITPALQFPVSQYLDRQIDRQIERQIDRQIDRQIEMQKYRFNTPGFTRNFASFSHFQLHPFSIKNAKFREKVTENICKRFDSIAANSRSGISKQTNKQANRYYYFDKYNIQMTIKEK